MTETTNRGSVLLAMVCKEESQIVLVCEPEKQPPIFWKLPGGKIEEGETPEEAASREAFEELGIRISPQELGVPTEFEQHGPSGPYVQYLFLVEVSSNTVASHLGPIVERIDAEGKRLVSNCFPLAELDSMVDFMPKHRDFIRSLGRQTRAA